MCVRERGKHPQTRSSTLQRDPSGFPLRMLLAACHPLQEIHILCLLRAFCLLSVSLRRSEGIPLLSASLVCVGCQSRGSIGSVSVFVSVSISG